MQTRKPISTISYNTDEFLNGKLREWKNSGLISYAMYINHEPDVDDKKPHKHVYIVPSRQIQTDDLEKDSCEIDKNKPDKPLKFMLMRSSKESDWILYGIHDRIYLQKKGLVRKTHYKFTDIVSTDDDTLQDMITRAKEEMMIALELRLMAFIEQGMTWGQICKTGVIPLKSLFGAKLFYDGVVGEISFTTNDGEIIGGNIDE